MTTTTVPAAQDFITPGHAAKLTGRTTRSLAALFDEGSMRGTLTAGGHRRYLVADVVALIPEGDA
jgi:hypothetical protein